MSDRASSSFTGTARALCRRSRCVFPARPLSPPTFCARHPQETAVSRRNSSTLRYGTLRGSVLGLEVVLPDGTIWDGLSIVAGFVLNVFRLRPEAALHRLGRLHRYHHRRLYPLSSQISGHERRGLLAVILRRNIKALRGNKVSSG
jgi:hypothetical protein